MVFEYCINCKYGIDGNGQLPTCRRDLTTEIHVNSKACGCFIKSHIMPSEPDIVKAIGVYKNNYELAEEIQKIIPIYYDESKNFWLWKKQEKFWKRIDDTDILNGTRKESGEYVIDSTTRKELITAIQMTGRLREVKPIKNNWVHVLDGVIDYNTKESFQATAEFFFTSPIPHKFGLDDNTPTIDKLFIDWMGDNAKILYEICAYCLIDYYPIHRMFLLFGRGRNGKSQFLKLLSNFVGLNNTTSTDLEKVIESRFEASKLYRKKLALIGETDFTAIKSTDRLKRLTGDDMITAEFKHKDPFDFCNTAKIIIATNNLPESLDKTDGFYSRCIILEFKNQFDEGKSVVDTIPETEYENLLFKCIKLLPELLNKGKFTGEGTIEDKAQNYERLSNPFPTFKEKELTEDIDAQCPIWILREAYASFCIKNGFRKVGDREFTQLLNKSGYDTKPVWWGKKKIRTVFGITTKIPYIYSSDDEENSVPKNQDAVTDGTLGTDVCNSPLYREQLQTRVPSVPSVPAYRKDGTDNTVTVQLEKRNGNTSCLSEFGTSAKDWICMNCQTITNQNKVAVSMWIADRIKNRKVEPSEVMRYLEKEYKLTPEA